MPRLMAVSLTEQQVRARTKTVTRRAGWRMLRPGDRLTLCKKVMGRRRGEPLDRIAMVEVISVRREPLGAIAEQCAAHRQGPRPSLRSGPCSRTQPTKPVAPGGLSSGDDRHGQVLATVQMYCQVRALPGTSASAPGCALVRRPG